MTECSACGQCCEVISLAITKDEAFRDRTLDHRTRFWMLYELDAIGPKEARRRAPWMFDRPGFHIGLDGRLSGEMVMYYTCRNYDEVTHLCAAHEDRPPVCRDYPTYGREVCHPDVKLPPRCSYRADLGQPIEEWTPVSLVDKAPKPV